MSVPVSSTSIEEVSARNRMLTEEIRRLTDENQRARQLIETHDQDFYDVKETLPETLDTSVRIRTIEDYTLSFLALSYAVAVVMLLFLYVALAPNRGTAFVQGSIIAAMVTCLMVLLVYYFA